MRTDVIFPYKPYHSGVSAKCRVRIYPGPLRQAQGGLVVVVTELPDNPGMSVTNYAEELATLIASEHDLDPVQTGPAGAFMQKVTVWNVVLLQIRVKKRTTRTTISPRHLLWKPQFFVQMRPLVQNGCL